MGACMRACVRAFVLYVSMYGCVSVYVCVCATACVCACVYLHIFYLRNSCKLTMIIMPLMKCHTGCCCMLPYVNTGYYCILYHKQVQCQLVNATFTRIDDVLSK